MACNLLHRPPAPRILKTRTHPMMHEDQPPDADEGEEEAESEEEESESESNSESSDDEEEGDEQQQEAPIAASRTTAPTARPSSMRMRALI